MIVMPLCKVCKYYLSNDGLKFKCRAFPNGVPGKITHSEFDHRQPFIGDRGYQFKPKDEEAAQYAEMIFSKK